MGEIFGKEQTQLCLREKVVHYAKKVTRRPQKPSEAEFKQIISTEMTKLFGEDWLKDDFVDDLNRFEALNRRTFELSSRISNELFFQFTKKFVKRLSKGSIFGSIEALSALGPTLLGIAPYLFSYAHQSRDKHFLSEVGKRFFGVKPELDQKAKKAWFTDTLTEVNGVTTLVHKMCRLAQKYEHDLTLISFSDRHRNIPAEFRISSRSASSNCLRMTPSPWRFLPSSIFSSIVIDSSLPS